MTAIRPQPGIMDIALYESGTASIPGKEHVLKLSSNENPAGCSDRARDAYIAAGLSLHRYPNTTHIGLRTAIAEVLGLDADRIVCGVGSDEVLQFLVQGFATTGDEVIYTEHGFSMYPILAQMVGATPIKVGETERRVDVDKILAACTEQTKLVFIANPANPTGTMIEIDEIARLADALPRQAILVLDGAYAEFAPGYDGGAALVETRENIVMTRTFSKLHGLGGLRIGWGYGPKAILEVMQRLRQPFNLSEGQLAAAEAAIRDAQWIETCVASNAEGRRLLTDGLRQIGVHVDESFANFVLARFADGAEAGAVDAALKDEGIIVRRVTGYGFPEGLRITVGDTEACHRILDVIGRFKGTVG